MNAPNPISESQYPAALAETAGLLARAAELLTRMASRPPAPRPASMSAPPTAAGPEYLTTREAAALLGVSVKGLEAMRARGLHSEAIVRVGKAVRYRRDALLRGGK